MLRFLYWCGLGDSNSWPRPWQGRALTTELNPHVLFLRIIVANLVVKCKGLLGGETLVGYCLLKGYVGYPSKYLEYFFIRL